ncbi:hypothetical protein [Sediminibacterium sp.]|uniref:hypothetical protein n=1 Tax=Sediminibacterium sp. TaxID=1917865 RepID=UPI003F720E10
MKKIIYMCLLVFVYHNNAYTQEPLFQTLYVHQAKAVYGKGEKIYGKLYIKQRNRLMMQPVNVYVDWYNEAGLLLQHQTYLAEKGGANISFQIPSAYEADYIRMRAYTLVTMNQQKGSMYCDQVVPVFQPALYDQAEQKSTGISADTSNSSQNNSSENIIELKPLQKSLGAKGKNDWLIVNKGNDFVNLSLSIVEEERFIPNTYSILKDFPLGHPSITIKSPLYRDAFIQVRGKFSDNPTDLKGAMVAFSLLQTGNLPIIDDVPVSDSGTFVVGRLNFSDSATLGIQLQTKKKKPQKIGMQFQQLGLFADAPTYVNDFGYSLPALRFQSPKARELASYIPSENEIVVYSTSKSPLQVLEEKYVSGLFKGGDAVSFNIMTPNAISFSNIFTYLSGKVPGLQIVFGVDSTGKGIPRFFWRSQQDMLKLFLNQVLVDAETILTLNINEIAFVKVFKPPFLGAALGAPNGAIAIYTKQGDEANYIPKGSKLTQIPLKGYTPYQPFKSPQYQSEKQKSVIDKRRLLHWISTIHLSQEKPTFNFTYFNNDYSKRHRMILEGVMQNGELIRKEWVVE